MTTKRLFSPAALFLILAALSAPVHAQTLIASAARRPDTTSVRVDSAPPAPPIADAAASPTGLTLSGYVESAFNVSSRPNGSAIAGRLYERTHNQFALNAFKLTLDRPFDPTKMDAGLHVDMVLGQNAPMLQSAGFNLGPNADVYQLYGTLNFPTANGHGVQVRVGRMATFMGVELIETTLNPNLSIGNAFIYVENFTQTGVSIEHRFNRVVDVQVRAFNGWDQVQDANDRLSYMVRLGLTPDAATSIAFEGYTGPEQSGNNRAMRSGAEVMVSRRVGKVTASVQGDVGREERNDALADPTRAAAWWAASSWVVIDATPQVGVALRADYLNDQNAARTGAAFGLAGGPQHRLGSATATLNVKSFPKMLLRPELRFDHSNQPVFGAKTSQFTFGMSVAYLF
jgi:hypothetical protein